VLVGILVWKAIGTSIGCLLKTFSMGVGTMVNSFGRGDGLFVDICGLRVRVLLGDTFGGDVGA
jgi:hypothetical protein